MTTRLDTALQKHPDHAIGIHLLATRDPSGNLKYLDWGARILASGQALAEEVTGVIEMFHRLRDDLLKLQRAQDRKRKKRERLYRIDGEMEVDVYDSPDLIVRHIKNKPASVHYGLGTKWCISMLREGHFEDYEAHNATFFFFERKALRGNEFDKVALMMSRSVSELTLENRQEPAVTAFTSTDRRVDMMILAKIHGPCVFEIFREIYERSERYPGSALFRVYDGSATLEQLGTIFASVASGDLKFNYSYEVDGLLESICCNPAASLPLLMEVVKRAPKLSLAAWKHSRRGRLRYRRSSNKKHSTVELERVLASALFLHHAVPPEVRQGLVKELRRRHVSVSAIHHTKHDGRVGVSCTIPHRQARGIYVARRRSRRTATLASLRVYVGQLERKVVRVQKMIVKAEAKKAKEESK